MLAETFSAISINTVFIILLNTIFYGLLVYLVVRILKKLWKRKQ